MAQNDFIIDNDTAQDVRLDIQAAFQAVASNSSGNSAPSPSYANMFWYDSNAGGGSDGILKIRNNANTSWINVGYVSQADGKFYVLNDTEVVTTGGVQRGLLGDQGTSTWETGTGTTESLVSPAKIKAAIIALYSAASGPDFTTQVAFTSSVTSAAHGLGAVPSRWQVKIVCTSTDLGYAVGDVICLTSHNEGGGLRGNTASVNATNIQIAGASVFINTKTAGGVTALTNSKWDVIFECWE